MTVRLRKQNVTVLTGSSTTADEIIVNTYTAQVATSEGVGTQEVQSYGAQALLVVPIKINAMSVYAQVMARADVDPATGGYANRAMMADIEEPDVIYYDQIFPECISYGSTGVPRYTTDKAEVLSGDEQRQQRHGYPKHEYSINMENLPAPEIAQIMNLWHICSGDYAGFLFLDPMDHTSGNTETNFSPTEITVLDQPVATASALVTDYPLYKYYTKGTRKKQRRIRYPKEGTLRVAVSGYEIMSWEYDYDLCVLRFTKPLSPTTVSNVAMNNGIITAAGTPFTNLAVGDLIFMSGWTDNNYNKTTGDPHRVVTKAGDNEIQVETYAGTTAHFNGTETDATVVFQSALPPTGRAITAGYYFYVPVRFDDGENAMSEINNGLRETAVATFGEIKLKELFE